MRKLAHSSHFFLSFSAAILSRYRRRRFAYFDMALSHFASVQLVRRSTAGYNEGVTTGYYHQKAVPQTVSDRERLICSPVLCGREIPIEPRQAGETVRCECGRTCAVPTMREIQSLRPAPLSVRRLRPARPAWGNPQRFLVAGLVVFLLAAIAAVILYRQIPTATSPDFDRRRPRGSGSRACRPMETIQYFHRGFCRGSRSPSRPELQSQRSMVYLGMAAWPLGAVGLILAAVGVAGIVRRRQVETEFIPFA